MKIFNFLKNNCNKKNNIKNSENARVKILGSGCSKCNLLEKNVVEALKILDKNIEVGHVTDFAKIANYGVMSTPALVVDNKVISYGKVLKVDEVLELVKDIL
ncbi:MTH895/ArsE family thioredoxin-like protein [Clostridium tarantellae]|uniref:Thioredoxin family protein n=1 Tax=Clostridium tarantellae TaxID=39493 RepID=A0A6I1MS75_9CLOT|nr:thioredoxin family protein [Clostridium tarantellae]